MPRGHSSDRRLPRASLSSPVYRSAVFRGTVYIGALYRADTSLHARISCDRERRKRRRRGLTDDATPRVHTYTGRTQTRTYTGADGSSGRFEPRDGFARAIRGRATRRALCRLCLALVRRDVREPRAPMRQHFLPPHDTFASRRTPGVRYAEKLCVHDRPTERPSERASERGNVAHLTGRDCSRNVTQQSRSGDVARSSGPLRRRLIPRASADLLPPGGVFTAESRCVPRFHYR